MQPLSIENLEEKLGSWEQAIVPDTLTLMLEKTDTALAYYVSPNSNQVKLFHRPNGFQLISLGALYSQRNFALPYADVKSIELFPATLTSRKIKSNWIYILVSGFIFLVLGSLMDRKDGATIWLPCGLVFGAVLSTGLTIQSKIMKIKLTLTDGQYFLFSCNERNADFVVDFFGKCIKEKFIVH